MNVTRTTRLGMILLFGWSCTAAVYAEAPVKLNLPLGTQRNVNYLKFSPDGSRVLYLADQDADDVFEIYSVPSAGTGGTVCCWKIISSPARPATHI